MQYELIEYRGKWSVRFTVGGSRRRLSTGFAAADEYREAAERKASEIVNSFTPSEAVNVSEIGKRYLADKEGRVVDINRLRDAWKRLDPFFGNMQAKDITRDVCRRYAAMRSEKVSDGTINKELRTLRAALRWANPQTPAVVECLPEPEPRDRWLTREEFSRLMDAATSEHLRVFLHLAIATAGRKEALLQLTWVQVRWDQNQIWLGKKANGKKRATVPMTKTLRRVLEGAHKVAVTDYVVEYNNHPVGDIRHAFERAVERAGLEDVHIHDLRHTAAVWMCGAGTPLEEISAYLGHSDIGITQRVYARHQPEHLAGAASALEV